MSIETVDPEVLEGRIIEPEQQQWRGYHVEMSREEYQHHLAMRQIWDELMHDLREQWEPKRRRWDHVWESIEDQRIEFFKRPAEAHGSLPLRFSA